MANLVTESGVMRLSDSIELVNLDSMDLLKVGDHQLVAHHLLISLKRTGSNNCLVLLKTNSSPTTMCVTTIPREKPRFFRA